MISNEDDIGGHLPRGPHQLTAEDVAADQRNRLLAAIVQFIPAKGYLATSVADLIKRAGVSRRTFYELYPNREELLKSAFETDAELSIEADRVACERSGGPTRQLEALMRRLCRGAGEHPGTAMLLAVEIAAAGPNGYELRGALMSDYATLIRECLSSSAEPPLPQSLAVTLAGAIHREIDAHLRTGRERELPELAPQLARWTRAYHPVPATFEIDAEPAEPAPSIGMNGLLGGRAPGTLTLAPEGYVQRVSRPSPGFLAHVNRERILDAVAQLNAKHGYGALTIEMIAEHADVPERAFRSSFDSKEESFATALELGHTKGQAIAERTRAGGGLWRESVRNTIRALLEFLASEPQFTRLAFLDAPLVSPALARRNSEHAAAYAHLVFEGAPQRRNPPPIAPEAIMQALFELAYRYAARDRAAELPRAAVHATYLALAPFLGVTEAAETAAGA